MTLDVFDIRGTRWAQATVEGRRTTRSIVLVK